MKPPCVLCDRPALCRGLCHTHHARWCRWGKPDLADWVRRFREGRLSTCAVCGRGFNGYFKQIYCSAGCYEQSHGRQSREHWRKRSPEAKRAAVRRSNEQSKAKRAERKVDKVCPYCGTTFNSWPEHVTCGDAACRRLHKQALQTRLKAQHRGLSDLRKLGAQIKDHLRRSDGGDPDEVPSM